MIKIIIFLLGKEIKKRVQITYNSNIIAIKCFKSMIIYNVQVCLIPII